MGFLLVCRRAEQRALECLLEALGRTQLTREKTTFHASVLRSLR